MKIVRQGSEMISGGTNSAPKKFQIQASGAAFAVLSSKLYNNKPLAIVRELSCNALDAHVAAGKADVPFDLHLPTNFEPWFAIRDFGIGLAPEAIEQLYCTYFASTKNDSNAYIGAMGLGSKSPFCYADNFTVTTYWDGKKHIYSAYIEKDGTPSVKKLSWHKTDEVNGLEIQFPVKPQDCWEFSNMAKVALEFFNPTPKINVKDFVPHEQNYSVRTPNWGMRATPVTHHTNGIRAIMGGVQYSVGNIDISRLTSEQRKLSQKPLDIFFPIGALSVAASREMLSNDERTIEAVLTQLNDIYTGMIEQIIAQIDACSTLWEARLLIFRLEANESTQGMMRAAISEGKVYKKYTNFSLSKERPYVNEMDYHHTLMARFTRSGGRQWANKTNLFTKRTPEVRARVEEDLKKDADHKAQYDVVFQPDPNMLFVINDLKFGGEKYLHHFLQTADGVHEGKKYTTAFLFSRYSKDTKQTDMEVEFLEIYGKMGGVPCVPLSTLKVRFPQLDERMPGQPSGPRRDALLLTGRGNSVYGKGWNRAWTKIFNAQIPTGKKYFVWVQNFTNMEVVSPSQEYTYAARFVEFVHDLKKCDILPTATPIYGLRVGTKLAKGEEWVELTSYVWKKFVEMMTPEKQLELSQLILPFGSTEYEDLIKHFAAKRGGLESNSPMKAFCDLFIITTQKETPTTEALMTMLKKVPAKMNFKVTGAINIQENWEQMVERHYPILSLDFSSYDNRERRVIEKLTEYVKNIDALTSQQDIVIQVPTAQEAVTV